MPRHPASSRIRPAQLCLKEQISMLRALAALVLACGLASGVPVQRQSLVLTSQVRPWFRTMCSA